MANDPPANPPGGEKPFVASAPQKAASMATYKRELRKEIKRRGGEHEA